MNIEKYVHLGMSPRNLTIIRRHIEVVRNSLPKVRQWQQEVHTIQQRCGSNHAPCAPGQKLPQPSQQPLACCPLGRSHPSHLLQKSRASVNESNNRTLSYAALPFLNCSRSRIISYNLTVKVLVFFCCLFAICSNLWVLLGKLMFSRSFEISQHADLWIAGRAFCGPSHYIPTQSNIIQHFLVVLYRGVSQLTKILW